MYLSTYDEILQNTIIDDVHTRFAEELRRIQLMGFTEDYVLCETAFPFSAIALLPMLVRMLMRGERVRIGGLLQLMLFNPFLIHEQGYAYASLTRLGVKYTTIFDDGMMLITTTFDNGITSNPTYRFIRQVSRTASPARAWQDHSRQVSLLSDEGHAAIAPLGVKDIIRIEMRTNTILKGGTVEEMNDINDKFKNEQKI